MHDPRYPIGKFRSVGRALSREERAAHVDAIRETPARMRSAVAGLSQEQLDTPYREGGWTVRQVVHHVVDSHVNAYCRFKLAATEDHPTIRPYDEKAWAVQPDTELPPEASLAILDALHARWVAFLDAVEPGYFVRTVHHPEIGDVTVDLLLELYAWHGPHHVAHVTELRARSGW